MPSVNTQCDREQLVNSIKDLQFIASQDIRRFHRKAYRYLGNTHDAEDAVQDAFLCAYQHLSGFRGQAQLSSWFTSIVINSARLQLRRRRHYGISNQEQFRSHDEAVIFWEAVPDHRPDPEQVCNKAEVASMIRQSIDRLSPRLRRAAHMYLLGGLNAAQVAEVLGVPLGTAKAQIARARAQIARSVRRKLGLPFSKPL